VNLEEKYKNPTISWKKGKLSLKNYLKLRFDGNSVISAGS